MDNHEHKHEHEHEHEHGHHDHDHHEIGCSCCDHCDHDHETNKSDIVTLIIGVILVLVSFLPILGRFPKDILRVIAAVLCAYPSVISAFEGLKKKKVEESLLMDIAVLAGMLLGDFFEAAAVAILFRVGEMLEDYANNRSRKSIESLCSIVSDIGHLVREGGGFEIIDADDITVGMKLAVLPYELIPVDGVIYSGKGTIDTSAITGESIPRMVSEGDKLTSGTVNGSTTLFYEATAVKSQSGAERIISMVTDAAANKSRSQTTVEKFAKYYTPAVIIAAVLIAIIPSIITKEWREWIHRALVILMASCPCAVVISVPLAFLSTMGACAGNGMIIKGSNFIEALAHADTVVYDKTGTLTTDRPLVGEVTAAEGYDREQVLAVAAKCEYYSTHPLGKAIVSACGEVDMDGVTENEEIAGGGVGATLPEGKALCGCGKFMTEHGIDISAFSDAPVYVALDGKIIGTVGIINELRKTSAETVSALRKLGITKQVMFTGDDESRAAAVSREIGLDGYKCELLPEEKLSALEELKSGGRKIIYAGDGINDAPVLAAADAGVAMGLGTRAACEAADVILTDSDLTRLADTVNQSKKTVGIMKANIAFAIIVKFVVIVLGIIGIAPVWLAVIADVGTMIICVLNAARLLKVQRIERTVTSEISA